jgi:hypothetical protein
MLGMYVAQMGSDLMGSGLATAASFAKPFKPMRSAIFVQRLAAAALERITDQVDRAVALAAVVTGGVGLQSDYFMPILSFRSVVLAQIRPLPVRATLLF